MQEHSQAVKLPSSICRPSYPHWKEEPPPPSPLSPPPLEKKKRKKKARISMGSLLENLQKKKFFPTMPYKDDLPTFQAQQQPPPPPPPPPKGIGLRKRLSSFSVNIQPLSTSTASAAEWAIRRSKSMPSIGEFAGGPLRRWWDRCWGWVLSRKPAFAQDIEMNEEETAMLGCHSKGSWRHLFHKVRSEIRKLMRPDSLPTTTQGFRYDSFSYAQNFDDGNLSMRAE